MNKLMGFYELKESRLPAIEWRVFTGEEEFEGDCLWTIRTAVLKGNDLNLPRSVGVSSEEANVRARQLYDIYKDRGMVIYYPFFIAEKSGTLNIFPDKVVIEAVDKDLWNLVTHARVDVTIIKNNYNGETSITGDPEFLSQNETDELLSYIPVVRGMFRNELAEGKSILLEWSFAYNCNGAGEKAGDKHLVFYEVRTV